MAKDPYDILGVKKDADDAAIKAAYRKLAKKYHPDLNPGNKEAETKFTELNNANEILSDPAKRAAFDRGETDAQGQPQYRQQQNYYRDYAQSPGAERYQANGAGAEGFDFSHFADLFSQFGGGSKRGFEPPADAHYQIEVTFIEAATGTKKRVTMPDGKALDITIPAGMDEGQQLRLKGQGAQPGGDAYVKIHIQPHPFFTRKGNDISLELPVALHESVLGAKISVPTIHGPVEMSIPKNAGNGLSLRLKGKGIGQGDQYVKLKLVMPKEIDAELEEAIRNWSKTHSYNPRQAMENAA